MVRIFLLILIALTTNSCISYYKNDEGIVLLKYPRYSLKDKKNFVFPKGLDTINVYRFYGYYENKILVKDANYENWSIYKKFYKNGRAFSFGTNKLREENLNQQKVSSDYYFYNLNTDSISYETFVIAEGGQYIIIRYKLSREGDTLTSVDHGKKSHVYIKTIIPQVWKKNR